MTSSPPSSPPPWDLHHYCGLFQMKEGSEACEPDHPHVVRQLFANSESPLDFETERLKGKMIMIHKQPDHLELSQEDKENQDAAFPYKPYLGPKRRRWEFRFQVQFKEAPQPNNRVLFGVEINRPPPSLNFATRALVRVMLSVSAKIAEARGSCLDCNLLDSGHLGAAKEDGSARTHFMFPLQTVDAVVCTPQGEMPPDITLKEDIHGRVPISYNFDTEHTYTFVFYSMYADFSSWDTRNLPGLPRVNMSRLVGHQPLRVSIFEYVPRESLKGFSNSKSSLLESEDSTPGELPTVMSDPELGSRRGVGAHATKEKMMQNRSSLMVKKYYMDFMLGNRENSEKWNHFLETQNLNEIKKKAKGVEAEKEESPRLRRTDERPALEESEVRERFMSLESGKSRGYTFLSGHSASFVSASEGLNSSNSRNDRPWEEQSENFEHVSLRGRKTQSIIDEDLLSVHSFHSVQSERTYHSAFPGLGGHHLWPRGGSTEDGRKGLLSRGGSQTNSEGMREEGAGILRRSIIPYPHRRRLSPSRGTYFGRRTASFYSAYSFDQHGERSGAERGAEGGSRRGRSSAYGAIKNCTKFTGLALIWPFRLTFKFGLGTWGVLRRSCWQGVGHSNPDMPESAPSNLGRDRTMSDEIRVEARERGTSDCCIGYNSMPKQNSPRRRRSGYNGVEKERGGTTVCRL